MSTATILGILAVASALGAVAASAWAKSQWAMRLESPNRLQALDDLALVPPTHTLTPGAPSMAVPIASLEPERCERCGHSIDEDDMCGPFCVRTADRFGRPQRVAHELVGRTLVAAPEPELPRIEARTLRAIRDHGPLLTADVVVLAEASLIDVTGALVSLYDQDLVHVDASTRWAAGSAYDEVACG